LIHMSTSLILETGFMLFYDNRKGMAYLRSLTFMTDRSTPTQSLFIMRFMWVFSIEAVQVSVSCFTCFQACSAYEMDMGMRKQTHVSVFFN
jgi:hypothetical protein